MQAWTWRTAYLAHSCTVTQKEGLACTYSSRCVKIRSYPQTIMLVSYLLLVCLIYLIMPEPVPSLLVTLSRS